jgi:hypothetical protein
MGENHTRSQIANHHWPEIKDENNTVFLSFLQEDICQWIKNAHSRA